LFGQRLTTRRILLYTRDAVQRPSLAHASLAALIVTALASIAPALLIVAREIAAAIVDTPRALLPSLSLIVRTLGVATLIAALATTLAWPAAWWARSRPRWGPYVLAAPMLLPSYLAYAGWGLLRAPGTWLGDLIARGPGAAVGNPAANWYPAAASFAQAILGLTFWVWPLAALVLSARLTRLSAATLDALVIDATRPHARLLELLRLSRAHVGVALLTVLLVMLGSAIPLHVAQLDTWAIHLWRLLDETPRAQHGRVWLSAWPLVVVAIAASTIVARSLAFDAASEAPEEPAARRFTHAIQPALAWTVALLAISVLAPALLFAVKLGPTSVLTSFARVSGPALATAIAVAIGIAIVVAALAALTWHSASSSTLGRRAALIILAVFLAGALVPGVLVGSATLRFWTSIDAALPRLVLDTWIGAGLAQIARFGFLGVLAGVVLARSEPRDLVSLRRVDAAPTLRAWIVAALPPGVTVVIAAGLAAGALSLHEIEATIMLEPPTAAGGSFARLMLQQLHFNRTGDLAAGVLLILALSGALAAVAASLACVARQRRRN
jgi:ABC-type Fe3+ transport system permease subunit